MAEAIVNTLVKERGLDVRAVSAGTTPGESINPTAAAAVREIGISLDGHRPKAMTQEMVDAADRIVTMGCGVDAAACPARFVVSDDWGLDDPAGLPPAAVRRIRDEIGRRAETLLARLGNAE
jgi:arsenate reductase